MFGLFKRKPHVCIYATGFYDTQVLMYETIFFERCICGAERIKRIYRQGPLAGRVVYEYIGGGNVR